MLTAIGHARRAFPLDFRFRAAEASFYARVRWKGSRPAAIDAIRVALLTDPFAMDMHRNLAGLLYEDGDLNGVSREIAFLKHYMPKRDAPIFVNANPATN